MGGHSVRIEWLLTNWFTTGLFSTVVSDITSLSELNEFSGSPNTTVNSIILL